MNTPAYKLTPKFYGDCDCCGNKDCAELFRVIAYGIETFICEACCENEDHMQAEGR